MADHVEAGVKMYDIRSDKSEASLLDMMKQSLSSEPKTMPTLLLYDEKGLRLFEDITYLKDYYLTNAEIDALTKHADVLAEHIPNGARVVELGSGNLRKVNILLEALERAQKEVDYFALDLSYPELKRTFAEVETSKFKYVKFNGFHGTYDDGLAWLSQPDHQDRVNCVLSLGSSMGNFSRAEAGQFLLSFSRALRPADLVIIGLDGTTDGDRIFTAYNDSEGVTEKFYRNGLDHANGILGYQAFKQEDWAILGQYVESENKHQASYVALKYVEIDSVLIKQGEKLAFEHANKYTVEQSDDLWHKSALIPKAVYQNASGHHNLFVLKPSSINFSTDPKVYAKSTVPSLNEWEQLWSAWDTVTRSMVPRDELLNKPIKLRNNLIFYLGHIPTFADIHYTRATNSKPTEPKYYYTIFERGIDPDVENPEICHAHSEIPDDWPPLEDILRYQLHVRTRIAQSIESGLAARDPKLARGLNLAYEHEALHLETFLYMLLQSDKGLAPPGKLNPDFEALARAAELERSPNKWHNLPASKFVVGANDPENNLPPERYFLWDNERPARVTEVKGFETQSRPISNGDYANFLEATRATTLPASWVDSQSVKGTTSVNGTNGAVVNGNAAALGAASPGFMAGKSVRTVYGLVPLKYALDWPIMASYDELAAFAKWSGGRIPTNEELKSIYHYVDSQNRIAERSTRVPAVNGHLSNDGVEETPPHGSLSHVVGKPASPALNPKDLFLDLKGQNVGFKFWHPVPVTGEGDRLRGQSDVGGLWEWTSTPLAAYDGFQSMALYPGYTSDFFDGKHNICLGGSWATVPRIAGRKSFVNWYQRNYPFVWCTARLVRDLA